MDFTRSHTTTLRNGIPVTIQREEISRIDLRMPQFPFTLSVSLLTFTPETNKKMDSILVETRIKSIEELRKIKNLLAQSVLATDPLLSFLTELCILLEG